jgi:hypothetical protein
VPLPRTRLFGSDKARHPGLLTRGVLNADSRQGRNLARSARRFSLRGPR